MIRDQLGVPRIMWGADYPHIEGTWPRTRAALRETLSGCDEAEIRSMLGETTAGVYGFDLAALQPLVERLGPSLDDLMTEESEPAARYEPVDYALGRVTTRETARRLLGGVKA